MASDVDTYGHTARLYDLVYEAAGKDYVAESAALRTLIQARNPDAATLADVACGTGAHLSHLRAWYDVVGVDLSPAMLEVARKRLGPDIELTEGDMCTFQLDRRFDAVTCLFSAIGHLAGVAELEMAVANLADHLKPGGVLVIDGWIRPDAWRDPGTVQVLVAERPEMSVVRAVRSHREGQVTTLDMHELVATTDGIDHFVEHHTLILFTPEQYQGALERAGLTWDVVPGPHPERDRYVAVRPSK